MALRVHAVLIGILSALIVAQVAADPSKSDPPASQVESLTVQVRELLAEPFTPYPDPWKPRRERPKAFCVVPGEKLSYPERLTAMGLAGLANRGGSRLFIRGHFGFNADADRFWLSRLAQEYGMDHRDISLDEALKEFRDTVCGAVICDEQLPATEAAALTLAGALRLVPALPSMETRLKAAGIAVVLDLRGVWKDHVAVQRWVFDVVGSRLNDQLIGFLDVRHKALCWKPSAGTSRTRSSCPTSSSRRRLTTMETRSCWSRSNTYNSCPAQTRRSSGT